MRAKLISKCTAGYVIEVDEELMKILTPCPDPKTDDKELRLYSYVKDAERYSYALTRFKKAIGEIVDMVTTDLSLKERP